MAPKTITTEHREAITTGRAQNAAVAAYLEALKAPRKRGRRHDVDGLRAKLDQARHALDYTPLTMLERLTLTQQRLDLEALLAEVEAAPTADTLAELETAFVEYAAGYSERKGISYAAWRATGVSAAVLRAAGIGAHG